MQRILATLKKQETDRPPFSAYMHSTVHERTIEKFVQFTLNFFKRYDPDYVKVMYDENYDTPVPFEFITEIRVWNLLEEFDSHIGAFGRQLEALKRIKDAVGKDVPVIQTIFSAFHVGHRLAHQRILQDLKEDREAVMNGLNTIAANYIRFADMCIQEAGIDGFFFAAFGCENSWMDEAQYKEMVTPTDKHILKTLRHAPILILHIHGEKDTHFNLLKDYNCDAISWEDRVAGPSIGEAREKTDKCIVGGIDHYAAVKCSPAEIVKQGREAIEEVNGRGIILAPGCTFFNNTPPENILALREAVGA